MRYLAYVDTSPHSRSESLLRRDCLGCLVYLPEARAVPQGSEGQTRRCLIFLSYVRSIVMIIQVNEGRTEDFPAFTQPFSVLRIYHIHDCMTIVVIAVPDRPYTPLPTQVPEFENCRG